MDVPLGTITEVGTHHEFLERNDIAFFEQFGECLPTNTELVGRPERRVLMLGLE